MKKIFVVDDKIAEGVESSSKSMMSALMDIVILEILTLIFIMIWQINLAYIDWTLTIVAMILPLCFVIFKIFFYTSSFFKGSMANLIPYIVLDNNKMLLIHNLEPTMVNIMESELDSSIVEKIINNEISGYSVSTFENVSLIKESKKCYYFKGNILDENGNNKGIKKFKIMKIYDNHEELKMVK